MARREVRIKLVVVAAHVAQQPNWGAVTTPEAQDCTGPHPYGRYGPVFDWWRHECEQQQSL